MHRLFFHLSLTHFFFISFIVSTSFKQAPRYYNSLHCPSTNGVATLCSPHHLHVAMTIDPTYLRGTMAAILSILQHSSCPDNIFFHFVSLASDDHTLLRSTVASSFPYLRFSLYIFNSSTVSNLISASIRPALDCPLNYARNYLANILPACVRRVVYLDSDVIVVDDIKELAATPLGEEAVLAAPEYCDANFGRYFTAAFWESSRLRGTLKGRRVCYFNTGVMVMEMERWRRGRYTDKIVEWMEVQKRMRIYQLGSLPPLLLVFAGKIASVDHRWNQHGLGGDNFMGLCRNLHFGPASLLHWSGKRKPWERLDAGRPCPLDALWLPYDLVETPLAVDV